MCVRSFSFLFGLGILLGCVAQPDTAPSQASQNTPAKKSESSADPKKVAVGKNVYLEVDGDKRRVLIQAQVCLRQGVLEQLLTRSRTKEHEAIVAADIDARDVHLALTLAMAEPGKTVQYRPKFMAPSGTAIKVFMEYLDKGKKVRVPAQQWLRNVKTKKDLHTDWVFAGSILYPDPLDKTKLPYYAANDGDVICISNFEAALLDVPFDSPKDNDDLAFEANTERIPAEKTAVTVILEPVLPNKK